jgi:hypothetical protein
MKETKDMKLGSGDIAKIGYEQWLRSRRPWNRIADKVRGWLGKGRKSYIQTPANPDLPPFDTTYSGQKTWDELPDEEKPALAQGSGPWPPSWANAVEEVCALSALVQESTTEEFAVDVSTPRGEKRETFRRNVHSRFPSINAVLLEYTWIASSQFNPSKVSCCFKVGEDNDIPSALAGLIQEASDLVVEFNSQPYWDCEKDDFVDPHAVSVEL